MNRPGNPCIAQWYWIETLGSPWKVETIMFRISLDMFRSPRFEELISQNTTLQCCTVYTSTTYTYHTVTHIIYIYICHFGSWLCSVAARQPLLVEVINVPVPLPSQTIVKNKAQNESRSWTRLSGRSAIVRTHGKKLLDVFCCRHLSVDDRGHFPKLFSMFN